MLFDQAVYGPPVINAISAGFDTTAANLIVGLCATTGNSDAITIQHLQVSVDNL